MENCINFAAEAKMRFDDVLGNEKLWAVVYDGDSENILFLTIKQWLDPDYLRNFFLSNIADLRNNFRITNLEEAIFDTVEDATQLACVILDIQPDADLNRHFRPLENYRTGEMVLSREKAKGFKQTKHSSWLRLYALKLDDGVFLVTGGAIKLTQTMSEREHTLQELQRMEKVRNYLLEQGVTDIAALKDYMT